MSGSPFVASLWPHCALIWSTKPQFVLQSPLRLFVVNTWGLIWQRLCVALMLEDSNTVVTHSMNGFVAFVELNKEYWLSCSLIFIFLWVLSVIFCLWIKEDSQRFLFITLTDTSLLFVFFNKLTRVQYLASRQLDSDRPSFSHCKITVWELTSVLTRLHNHCSFFLTSLCWFTCQLA